MRGFKVPCPLCGEEDSVFIMLHETEAICCNQCDVDIDISDLKERIASWQALIAWLETAPEIKE